MRPAIASGCAPCPTCPRSPVAAGVHERRLVRIVAPAGTPAPIVSKLNAELKRALANAEFSKSIDAIGMEPAKGGTPQELREWIASELARWTKVVRDAGIQAQAN